VPVEPHALLRDLQPRVRLLEDDLRQRVEGPDGAEQRRALVEEHRRAVASERTSATWLEFRDDEVTQAAVAWVLATVFTRFCEDNDLVPDVWIAGPGARTRLAAERQQAFLVAQPLSNDRDWLLAAFDHLASYPALAALLDHEHNPLHRLSISADAAEHLLGFWRRTKDDGELVHDLTDPDLSTRFLGDLYQDLSEAARTKYALLQTPEFVEEFILDQTLDPALAERPLEGFKMIDPTCGSGHFLLGTFYRLFDRWSRERPASDLRDRVQRALDAVHGVDLNPFAVAVARFRLTLAAMKADGTGRLRDAPAYRFHLAVGDSLLHGSGSQTLLEDSDLNSFAYSNEDLDRLQRILFDDTYDVVVGNPPYIAVKDPSLNQAYRARYMSCKGSYALSVPFMERFFGLARAGDGRYPAGWVGQITSNSFMKRDFGSRLIEEFLPQQDLKMVIDSEGASIPGHNLDGTPTVMLVGRAQSPVKSTVRMIMSKGRREGSAYANGSGPYWTSIVEHVSDADWENDWISVVDLDRAVLASHPWSLAGGGAPQLLQAIERRCTNTLGELSSEVGRTTHTGNDEAFFLPLGAVQSRHLSGDVLPAVLGEDVRDYEIWPTMATVFPYTSQGEPKDPSSESLHYLWRVRRSLETQIDFGKTKRERGLRWFDHSMFFPRRFASKLSIVSPFVTTHNHFVLDRGGKVFNRSAPAVKLRDDSTEDDAFGLLGYLNSSVCCFWMKNRSQPKGGAADLLWSRTYEFTVRTIEHIPVPRELPVARGRRLDELASRMTDVDPASIAAAKSATGGISVEALVEARRRSADALQSLIAEQEELDWEVYTTLGLVGDGLVWADHSPALELGERAFEVRLAREPQLSHSDESWFDNHEAGAYAAAAGALATELPGPDRATRTADSGGSAHSSS